MSPASVSACVQCGEPIALWAEHCPHCGAEQPRSRELSATSGFPGVRRRNSPRSEAWRTNFHAGLSLIGGDDYAGAVARLSQALVEAPEEELAPCYSTRGYAFLCLGEYQRALDDCTEALRLDPSDGEAYAWRGAAYAGLGDWRRCLEDYIEAIALAPDKEEEYGEVAMANAATAIQQLGLRLRQDPPDAETYFARGVAHAFRGDFESAIADLTHSLELRPDPQAYFKRAECYCAQGEFERVVADCTSALQLEPDRADTLYYRGAARRQLGRLREAAVDLHHTVKINPGLASAWFELALTLESLGQPDDVLIALGRAIDLTTEVPRFFVVRGRIRLLQRDFQGAVEDFTRALELETTVDTLLARGRAFTEMGEIACALQDFDAALQRDPVCAAAFCGRGAARLAEGDPEQAVLELGKAIRLDGRYSRSFQVRGEVHAFLGNWQESHDDFTRGIELPTDPSDRVAMHRGRAQAAMELGRFAEAELDLCEVLTAAPGEAEVLLLRAVARGEQRKWPGFFDDLLAAAQIAPLSRGTQLETARTYIQAAVEEYTEKLADAAEDLESLFQRGRAFELLGELANAYRDYTHALRISREHVGVLLRRANVLAATGKHELAVADCTLTLQLDSNAAGTYYLRAGSYRALGRFEEAIEDLSQAIRLAPRVQAYHLARGKLLARVRRHEAAAADFTHAIALNRRDPRPLADRGSVVLVLGQSEAALRDFHASLKLDPHQPRLHVGRGDAYAQRKQWRQAAQAYSMAVELDIDLVDAHSKRALALARGGAANLALVELTKAAGRIRFNLAFAAMFETRGRIFHSMRQYAKAVEDFENVFRLQPPHYDFAPLHFAWGQSLWQLGTREEARGQFERAAELRPDLPAAIRVMEWFKSQGEPPVDLRPPATETPRATPPVIRQPLEFDPQPERWVVEPYWDQWLVRTADGREFGPLRKSELDSWCREGRLDDQTLVLRIDWDDWCWCGDIYYALTVDSHRSANRPIPLSYLAAQEPVEADDENSGDGDFPSLRL